jgi:hypothetical protein
MALVAVFGPHAIGKTTALERFAKEQAQDLPHVTVVLMDNNLELWWDGPVMKQYRYSGRTHWKGSRADKLNELWPCIEATEELVIVETARISHVHETIADGYKYYGGGVQAVITTCTPDTMREFLVARCESKGKMFNEKYWDHKRLVYESRGRYMNAAKKHFAMNGIPWTHITIGPERLQWTEVIHHLCSLAELPLDKWY